MSFYDYSVTTPKGEEISMKDYAGKVVMVVNTATGCGFTPHYKDIEDMYEKYHDQGFEVIDVPCNQFKGQAPGTDEEIHEFCQLHYNTKFPQMKKSDVNGENAIPLAQDNRQGLQEESRDQVELHKVHCRPGRQCCRAFRADDRYEKGR